MSWTPRTLGQFLAAAPRAAEALVTPTRRLSYGELHEGARRVARALHGLGLRKGDRAAMLMDSDEYWLTLFYGAGLLGVVTVPVEPRCKAVELEDCLRQSGCKAIFLGPKYRAPKLEHRIVLGEASWRRFAAGDRGQSIRPAVAPDDLLLIAKRVMLTHDNMLRNAWAAGERMGVTSEDRYFNCHPFSRLDGLTLSALVCLVHGACLVTRPAFEPGAALAMMEKERCTLTSGNETIFRMLMAHADLPKRRLVLRGGWAAARPQTMRRIIDVLGAKRICAAYGLAEASPSVAMSDWRDPRALRVAGLATPHEGLDLRTLDGEIQVRGWSVMRGYCNDAEATARAFTADGFLRTGDLGELRPGGRLRALAPG